MLTPVAELVKSKFKGTQPFGDLQPGQGRAISFQGKRAGIYRRWDDRAFVVDITCTHMGGELSFNPAEKTWDCPVHGGRFDVRGNRLEGPPHRNLRLLFQGDFSQLTQG
ncbi:hypothetical protein SDC9_161754 [bioreactor metagenome]|uniref:Rieske domain-containing protein n=1 Tax=bioreactor metagenome TaxID=1076179 RepID=A0A645FJ68_9ZZZZ